MESERMPLGLSGAEDAFKQLYLTRDHSDFVIVCGKSEYKVHKMVLLMHSDVLYGMATNPRFTESRIGQLDLSADDVTCVEAMIYYFYHFDYQAPKTGGLSFHVRMCVLANKYNIKTLEKEAALNFGLFDHPSAEPEVFAEAVDEAYETSVASQEICEEIVRTLVELPSLLAEAKTTSPLLAVIVKHPQLATDALQRLATVKMADDEQRGAEWYSHGDCRAFKAVIPCNRHYTVHCTGCGEAIDGESWEEFKRIFTLPSGVREDDASA